MLKLLLIGLKDLKLMFRDRAAMTFMLLAPFLLTLGMGFVTGSFGRGGSGLSDIPVVLVNLDNRELGNALVDVFYSEDLSMLVSQPGRTRMKPLTVSLTRTRLRRRSSSRPVHPKHHSHGWDILSRPRFKLEIYQQPGPVPPRPGGHQSDCG